MKMNNPYRMMFVGLLGLTLVGAVQAHDDHSEHADHHVPAPYSSSSEVSFSDLPLTDQHGQTVQLEQDLVHDRIVVMSFIYTSCTTVCPLVSSIMGRVQQQLGERVGSEVQLISISVDPQTDTPERLLDYSKHFQDGPGWSWLTGSPQAVTSMLKALGSWSADYANHPPLIMVGSSDNKRWSRYYGFTDPEVLVARVEELAHARAEHHAHASHSSAEALAGVHVEVQP